MNDKQWDKQIFDFLKRTGDEIKAETQRLLQEVRDPVTQQRVKERLREFGTWVKGTAEDAADAMERAIKKAETAFTEKAETSSDLAPGTPVKGGGADATTSAPHAAPPSKSRRKAQKTVGKSKRAGAKKGAPRTVSKTIGRKR
jgi:hypothetical protein